MLSKLNC